MQTKLQLSFVFFNIPQPPILYRCTRAAHCSKQCCSLSLVTVCRLLLPIPQIENELKCNFHFWKGLEAYVATSGEYGECSSIGVSYSFWRHSVYLKINSKYGGKDRARTWHEKTSELCYFRFLKTVSLSMTRRVYKGCLTSVTKYNSFV